MSSMTIRSETVGETTAYIANVIIDGFSMTVVGCNRRVVVKSLFDTVKEYDPNPPKRKAL